MVWSPKKNRVESKNKLGGSKHKSVTNIRIQKNKIGGVEKRIKKRIKKKIQKKKYQTTRDVDRKFLDSFSGSVFGSYSRVRQNELFPTPKSIPKTSPKSTPKTSPRHPIQSPRTPPRGALAEPNVVESLNWTAIMHNNLPRTS